jgi:hypothetical protein
VLVAVAVEQHRGVISQRRLKKSGVGFAGIEDLRIGSKNFLNALGIADDDVGSVQKPEGKDIAIARSGRFRIV